MSQGCSAKRDCTKPALQAQREGVKLCLERTEVQMMEQSSCGSRMLEFCRTGLTNWEEISEDRKVGVNKVERDKKMMEYFPPRKGRSEGSREKRMNIKLYKGGKQD